jgi:NTE family protein
MVMTKRALVLGGGGARGSFQVGMLEHLVGTLGLDFEIIRGVSVGALNASYLAQASMAGDSLANLKHQVGQLRALWTQKIQGNYSVYQGRPGSYAGLVAGADSLFSLKPLRGLIESDLDVARLRNSGRDFSVGYASLVSGDYAEASADDPDFIERLVSSASIPVVFPFVDLNRDVFVDGGVRNITPLASAFRANPDEVYVLMTSRAVFANNQVPTNTVLPNTYEQWDDNWLGTKVNGFDVLERTLDIILDEVYLEDIRSAIDTNEIMEAMDAARAAYAGNPDVNAALDRIAQTRPLAKKRSVKLFVLAPQQWFGDKNSSTEFSPTLINQAIEHGRQVAADPSLWLNR